MLGPGESFERYTIEALLGEGGMGRVYRALDSRLHRRVALKILSVEAATTPDLRSEGVARLIREARAAAVLDHPNSVAIYDVGEVDGEPYIAMELVNGRTLRSYVGEAEIAWEIRLRWLVDVARALSAAHKAGLVHRDIKPENVMVREDGVVKVLDFGVARRASSEIDVTGPTQGQQIPTITGKGIVIGTPVYMSPEQMRGLPVDGRSDQFAWGVLAYELLAGRRPWRDHPDALAMVATILSEPPESLRSVAEWDVPGVVEHVVHKTLRRTSQERYAAMDDVIAALEPFVRVPTPSSKPPPSQRGTVRLGRARAKSSDEVPDSRDPAADTRTTRRGLAASTVPRPGPLQQRRWAWAAALLLILGGSGFFVWKKNLKRPTPPVIGTKHTQVSQNPAAQLAWEEGLQAMQDGSSAASMRHFEEAAAKDPTLAAAFLRLCLGTFENDATRARGFYRRASEHRASLDAHDLALFEATEPFMREPPDVAEWEKRLALAVGRFPTSAELLYYLGYARQIRNNFEGADDAYQKATQIDPHFALAWWSRGEVEYLDGDISKALASYDECLKRAPQATICLLERARVYRREGECAKMEAEAKAAITKEPDSALAHYYLAEALYARGRPVDTVKEALDHYFARLEGYERSDHELFYGASLANLAGDFVQAEKLAREKEKLVETRNDRADHFNVAALLTDIYVESGRQAEAARVADTYLARQDLWVGFTNPLFFENVLYRAGKMDLKTFETRRAEWLATQQEEIRARGEGKTGQIRERAFPWIDGYADFVQSRDEAAAALALMPVYLPMPPPTRRNVGREMDLGKVRVLAGDADGALFHLKRASAHCGALDYPSPHTRAFYYLGLANEALGKRDDACAAYGVVLARWGNAKPASVTAAKTKERTKALGCK